jgi:hypothetical protein
LKQQKKQRTKNKEEACGVRGFGSSSGSLAAPKRLGPLWTPKTNKEEKKMWLRDFLKVLEKEGCYKDAEVLRKYYVFEEEQIIHPTEDQKHWFIEGISFDFKVPVQDPTAVKVFEAEETKEPIVVIVDPFEPSPEPQQVGTDWEDIF